MIRTHSPARGSKHEHVPDRARLAKATADRQAGRYLATNDRRWRAMRAAHLQRHPLCEHCRRQGRATVATDVDHIDRDTSNNLPSNLQSLCKSHHSRKTASEGSDSSPYPGWLTPPACRLVVVWGPPMAGKSTLCRERAQPGDVIIDWDEILYEVTGKSTYRRNQREANQANAERNRRIAELADADPDITAWVPTCAPRRKDREWWESLGAELIALTPLPETLYERAKSLPHATARVQAIKRFQSRLEL